MTSALTNIGKDTRGCNLFVTAENLRVVNTGTPRELYDLTPLARCVGTIDQIQMCSVIRRFFLTPRSAAQIKVGSTLS